MFLSLFFFPSTILANSHLLIVEIQIQGEENSNDFVKIYNPTENTINIEGFQLKKKSSTGKEYSLRVFPKGSEIKAKNYFVWANSKNDFSKKINADIESTATLSKNNSLALLDKEKDIVDALCWGNPKNPFKENECFPKNPGKGQKLLRKNLNQGFQDTNNNKNDFYLSPSKNLPEKENKKEETEQATSSSSPIAIAGPNIISQVREEIHFNGSKSYDPDNDHLFFFWNFGDGSFSKETSPVHSYQFPGKYTVVLEVSDGKNKSTDQILVTILPKNIFLSEFSPKEGWIEIWNKNSYPVNLSNWKVKNGDKEFVFPKNFIIPANQFLVIPQENLGFILASKGSLSIFSPENSLIEKVTYQESKGESIALNSKGDFLWTSEPTPGFLNIWGQNFSLNNISSSSLKTKSEEKETYSFIKAGEQIAQEPQNPPEKVTPQIFSSASLSTPRNNKIFFFLGVIISLIFTLSVLILKKSIEK